MRLVKIVLWQMHKPRNGMAALLSAVAVRGYGPWWANLRHLLVYECFFSYNLLAGLEPAVQ
jgi:hypothetical protein